MGNLLTIEDDQKKNISDEEKQRWGDRMELGGFGSCRLGGSFNRGYIWGNDGRMLLIARLRTLLTICINCRLTVQGRNRVCSISLVGNLAGALGS